MERSPLPVRNDVVCHFHSSSSSLWKQRKLPVTKQQCRTPPDTIQCTRPPPPAAQFVSVSLAARTNHWRVKKTTSNSPTMAGLLVSPSNQNTESQALSLWRSMPREDNDQSKISKSQWNTSASSPINTELNGRTKEDRLRKQTQAERGEIEQQKRAVKRRKKIEFSRSARLLLSPSSSSSPGKAFLFPFVSIYFITRRRTQGKGNLITFALYNASVVWTTRACCPPGHWLGPVTGLGQMSPT